MALLAAPVIGGVSSLGGSISGAVFLYGMTFFFAPHVTGLFGEFGAQIGFQLALGGLGVVVTLLLYPSGIAGFAQRWWQRYLDALAAAKESTGVTDPSRHLPLAVSNVVVRFGGVQALAGASIEVRPGEIVGLIGPNGAGKSTLMNVVSGTFRPEHGSVRAFGTELVGLGPEYRSGFGVGRSFQDAQLFAGLTVTQAIQVAVDRRHRVGVVSSMLRAPWARAAERESRHEARELVERLGLTDYADTRVGELSTGTRRVCDLAAQTAARPQVLLLDEPTAGVAQREAEAFGPLLRQLRDELDCSILVIEHDMVLLMGLCDRVYAMEAGQIIAEGTPAEIRANPLVIASYLGTNPVSVNRSSRVNGTQGARRTTKKTATRTPATSRSRVQQELAK
jgi:ABC-type branched-subunit amino acid transport system ATPase component